MILKQKLPITDAVFFAQDGLVFCGDIGDLMTNKSIPEYRLKKIRIFIGSPKRSLISVLLHNDIQCGSTPFAQTITIK